MCTLFCITYQVVSQPDLYPVNKSELPPYPGDDAPPTATPDANTATNNNMRKYNEPLSSTGWAERGFW